MVEFIKLSSIKALQENGVIVDEIDLGHVLKNYKKWLKLYSPRNTFNNPLVFVQRLLA